MKKKSTVLFSLAVTLFVLFLAFTVTVALCGKTAVVYDGDITSEIGFGALNKAVFDTLGTSAFWYEFTEFLGTIALAIAALFALIGISRLAARKRFWAVDREILLLALFYLSVAFFYLLFEVIVINYRPILVAGALEASYPSSHAMLGACIFVTAPFACRHLVKNNATHTLVGVCCYLFAALTVVGRLLSGLHWLTDVIGALLLSASLILFYLAAITLLNKKAEHKHHHHHSHE